jgi:hypothetical protein
VVVLATGAAVPATGVRVFVTVETTGAAMPVTGAASGCAEGLSTGAAVATTGAAARALVGADGATAALLEPEVGSPLVEPCGAVPPATGADACFTPDATEVTASLADATDFATADTADVVPLAVEAAGVAAWPVG